MRVSKKTCQNFRGCFGTDKTDEEDGLAPINEENAVRHEADRKDDNVLLENCTLSQRYQAAVDGHEAV